MSLPASGSCLGSRKQGAQSTATHSRAAGRRARKFGRGIFGQRRRGAISSDAPPFFAKNRNLSDFGGFQSPEVRGKDVKTFQISMIGFQCVAKIAKDSFFKCISCLIYNSQIWLNLLSEDRHFFYIFLWTIATLAPQKKLKIKKNAYAHW
jgi:hypothetical protein